MSTATENTSSPSACDRLLDYVYGELTGDALDEFKLHLLGCDKCKRELAGLERVRSAVKQAMPSVEPAADKMAAMQAKLMQEAAARQKAKRGKVLQFARRVANHPAYAMAAMFAIVCGVVTLNWSMGRMAMPVAEKSLHEPMAPAPAPVAAEATTVTTEEAKPVGAPATPNADPMLAPAKAGSKPIETYANDKTLGDTKISLQTGAPASPSYAVKSAPLHQEPPKLARKEAPAELQNEESLDGIGAGEGGRRAKAHEASKRDNYADDSALAGLSSRHASGGADLNQGYAVDGKKKPEPARSAPVVAAAPPPAPPSKFAELEKDERQAPMGAKNQAPAGAAAPGPSQNQTSSPSLAASADRPVAQAQANRMSPPRQKAVASDPMLLKKQAQELALADRCDEAVPLYQQLERQSPSYLTPTERLNYVKCLRLTGRVDAAESEMVQLKTNKAQLNSEINAEQVAIEREKKAGALRQQTKRAAKAKAAAPASSAPADADKASDKAAY